MSSLLLRIGLQLFIGGLFMASALGKSLDVPGFIEVLRTYRAFPETSLSLLAHSVIAVEAILGVWMLSGWRLRDGALAAALVNLGYAVWMTASLLRGLELANCGCFGVFFPQPLRWYSPLEDLVLVGGSVVLWRAVGATGAGQDSPK